MKQLVRNIALAVLLVASAHAQMTSSQPVGQVIKNFSMPQADANGTITSVTTGDEAKVISSNRTEIKNMKIELYEGNDVSTVILSPRCDLWKSINKLRTRDGVIIKKTNMEITAQTMDWECTERRGVLRQNVRVTLQDFSLSKPLGGSSSTPAAPAAPSPTTDSKPVNPSEKP